MHAVNDVKDRILAIVKSILAQNAITAEVNPETLLVDVGLSD